MCRSQAEGLAWWFAISTQKTTGATAATHISRVAPVVEDVLSAGSFRGDRDLPLSGEER